MKILVTGGAGYIGSHTVRELLKKGHEVVIYDNLFNGHKEFVPKEAILIKGDLSDTKKLESVFKRYKIDAVIHFAAFIEAGESVTDPLKFFNNNVVNSINLISVMIKNSVKKIIYSSSASVYGIPKKVPIDEDSELKPINPYGETKFMVEKILKDCDTAHDLKFIALRYFNAAGASMDSSIGEMHNPETHLVPLILQVASGKRKDIKIFGTDYKTKDGTCIRDYIHVIDLANAHILALEALNKGAKSNFYNLGNERGYSVKEVIDMCRKVTGKEIPAVETERRPGDPDSLIASSKKIKKELGWKPLYDLKAIVESAWNWHKKN
jgi:UDP-glucose 4-epimerase